MTDKEYFIDFWTPTCGREEAERAWGVKQAKNNPQAPMVMGDIQPYKSQIDGTIIESRSKHRAHLKANNCIEIGNETKYLYDRNKPLTAPPGLKDQLIRAVEQHTKRRSN